MVGKVKQLKDEGKPMPKDYQQLEKDFGEHSPLAKIGAECLVTLLAVMLTHCSAWLVM